MKTFFAATLALSMLAAPAMAAPNDMRPGHPGQAQNSNQNYNHPYNQNQQKPQAHKPQPQKYQAQKYQQKPQYNYNGRQYTAYHGPAWKAPKGYTAHRYWNRGQKLPSAYRERTYVIDYRAYRLKQPPRGYQWVRVNNNAYLVQQSNGLIAQIVLSMFY